MKDVVTYALRELRGDDVRERRGAVEAAPVAQGFSPASAPVQTKHGGTKERSPNGAERVARRLRRQRVTKRGGKNTSEAACDGLRSRRDSRRAWLATLATCDA